MVNSRCGQPGTDLALPRPATWIIQGLFEEVNQFNQSSGYDSIPRRERATLQRRLVGLQADCLSWLRQRGADRRSAGYQDGIPVSGTGTAAETPQFSNPIGENYLANPQVVAGATQVGTRVDFQECGFNEGDIQHGRGQARFSFYTGDVTAGNGRSPFGQLAREEHESEDAFQARVARIDVNLDDRYETITVRSPNQPIPLAQADSSPAPAPLNIDSNNDDPLGGLDDLGD